MEVDDDSIRIAGLNSLKFQTGSETVFDLGSTLNMVTKNMNKFKTDMCNKGFILTKRDEILVWLMIQ